MTRPAAGMIRSLIPGRRPRPRLQGRFDELCAALLRRGLDGIERGSLTICDRERRDLFGDGGLQARLEVHSGAFYRRALFGGTVGAAESYVDGEWDCDDLVALVRVLVANRDQLERLDGCGTRLAGFRDRMRHLLRRNSRSGSRRNIGAHYDLSNALFETFLDERMMYSSAVYEHPELDLEAASTAKLERLCRKLELQPDDHLLEIGSGWGGLAVYAASRFGCRVTTTTISEEQHRAALERVRAAGLEDRIRVLLRDYRELDGTYDKLVSVEMVEAVGHQYLQRYFAVQQQLLKPGGLAAIQAITIEDRHYRAALHSVDFIKKHIFPGSFIPCVSELVRAAARASDLVLVNLEDIGLDYARTLGEWRRRVNASRERILQLGFDERFLRLWNFYLAYCEGGFRERALSDVQLLFARPGYRNQPWRARLTVQPAP